MTKKLTAACPTCEDLKRILRIKNDWINIARWEMGDDLITKVDLKYYEKNPIPIKIRE